MSTRIVLRLLAALLIGLLPAAAVVSPASAAADAVEVTISEVDLDGPTIADVTVTVTNHGDARMSRVAVTFAGPKGWTVHPDERTLQRSIRPGASAEVEFQIRVPEPRPGFRVRTFRASVSYRGGDGAGTAVGERVQRTGEPLPDLAGAFDNVGVTSESDTAPGDFDGDGNSFSAERLAEQGVTPGGTVTALGTTFTWPDVVPGAPNNATAGGQAIELDGTGSRLAFLGSGSSYA
ncbi:MAG TPA: NEW3 domain-containing protein, partial [Nocardioides sp.]|nr:NEW3 domain-containing protein [Nocardioides sp.]